MRNSIRKIASLCLAMAMILSLLAVPAFAEMRSVHIHEYDLVDSYSAYTYEDEEYHVYTIINTYGCDCNETYREYLTDYLKHVPDGGPIGTETSVDAEGNAIIVTLYKCRFCSGTYPG